MVFEPLRADAGTESGQTVRSLLDVTMIRLNEHVLVLTCDPQAGRDPTDGWLTIAARSPCGSAPKSCYGLGSNDDHFGSPPPKPAPIAGDFDGDGVLSSSDRDVLRGSWAWGSTVSAGSPWPISTAPAGSRRPLRAAGTRSSTVPEGCSLERTAANSRSERPADPRFVEKDTSRQDNAGAVEIIVGGS